MQHFAPRTRRRVVRLVGLEGLCFIGKKRVMFRTNSNYKLPCFSLPEMVKIVSSWPSLFDQTWKWGREKQQHRYTHFEFCPERVWSVEDINAEIVINRTIPFQNKLMLLKSWIFWQSQGCYQQVSLIAGCLFVAVFPCCSDGIPAGPPSPSSYPWAVGRGWTGQGCAESGDRAWTAGAGHHGPQPGAYHKSCMWCWTYPNSSWLQNCAWDWPRISQNCGQSLRKSEVVLRKRMCVLV